MFHVKERPYPPDETVDYWIRVIVRGGGVRDDDSKPEFLWNPKREKVESVKF
jgi:hypothetical protein